MTRFLKLLICATYYLGALTGGFGIGELLHQDWGIGCGLLMAGAIAVYVSRRYLRKEFWR